jgi:hypothetical protein
MAFIFGLLTILAFVMGILTIVATVQIIVKAGYSGWWILVPLGAPAVALIVTSVVAASTQDLGARSVNAVFDALVVGVVIDFLIYAAVWACFMKFAFSDWPVLQAARARQAPPTNPYGGGGGFRPPGFSAPASGPLPGMAPPPPAPASPPAPAGSQPPGWYRVGPVGAGEQGYWDGQAWTGRRKWTNGEWLDLPTEMVGPDESGATQGT